MGTWGTGPFDNDTAADWCGDLDDAALAERAGLVRAALEAALAGEDGVDADVAMEAVAAAAVVAAAVVASQRPGGAELVATAYAPDFLEAGGTLDLPPDLAPLAVRALAAVEGEESEWRELWDESGEAAAALEALADLRTRLT